MEIKRIDSNEGNVAKFVFTTDDYVAEAVLYRYPDYKTRTVICCSTMSGCPMGCRFCGAGDFYAKTLTGEQIISQVKHCISETGLDASEIERLQIMFMSMGEPLLNKRGLRDAIIGLYDNYPDAALLVSTSAPRVNMSWFNTLSHDIPTVGLQFSVHESTDEARDKLIPFQEKMNLIEIAFAGLQWHIATGRDPFFNYCAHSENSSEADADRLVNYFDPKVWQATISVVCERNEGLPARNEYQQNLAKSFSEKLLMRGYNVRVFDPAGQDDIGGGCGQLWFVQDWANKHPDKTYKSCGTGKSVIHTPGN
jgi:23S rRNA (adenine2503-C2)-methyltransferase